MFTILELYDLMKLNFFCGVDGFQRGGQDIEE